MKKKMTFGQRMDLAMKLCNYFLMFVFVGLFTAGIGGGMGYKSLLILGIFLFAVGVAFFVVSMQIRYREEKPKWQQDVERKMNQG